jgi:hypothetical protein
MGALATAALACAGAVLIAAGALVIWVYRALASLGADGLTTLGLVVATIGAVAAIGLRWLSRWTPIRIARGWPNLARGLGLVRREPRVADGRPAMAEGIPRLRLRPFRGGGIAEIRLLPGQHPDDISRHLDAISHAWGIREVEVTSPRLDRVQIRLYTRDPLAQPIPALPEPLSGSPKVLRVTVSPHQGSSPGLRARLLVTCLDVVARGNSSVRTLPPAAACASPRGSVDSLAG